MPLTIWSARRWIEKNACTSAASPPAPCAAASRRPPRAELVRARRPRRTPPSASSLEPDVHHAASLGEHAADRGERQRRRVAERRGEERRPDDDTCRVSSAGDRGEGAREAIPRIRARDRAPREAATPRVTVQSRRRPPIASRRGAADRAGGGSAAERAKNASRIPGAADPAMPGSAWHAVDRLARSTPRCRRSELQPPCRRRAACLRAKVEDQQVGADEEQDEPLDDQRQVPASSGGNTSGSRFRSRFRQQRAEEERREPDPDRGVAPSSATAIPMNPIVEPWTSRRRSGTASRGCPPRPPAGEAPAIAIARK